MSYTVLCRCGGRFSPNKREWAEHPCESKPTLDQYPSATMTADEWFRALMLDDGLYYRLLDGIAKETEAFRRKFGRLPEAGENGRRSQSGSRGPERSRNIA